MRTSQQWNAVRAPWGMAVRPGTIPAGWSAAKIVGTAHEKGQRSRVWIIFVTTTITTMIACKV